MPLISIKIWFLLKLIQYEVSHRYHFKNFIPFDYRGLKDYLSQRFTPSFMAFSEKNPFLDDGTWTFIEDPQNIAAYPLLLNIEIVDIDLLHRKAIRYFWREGIDKL